MIVIINKLSRQKITFIKRILQIKNNFYGNDRDITYVLITHTNKMYNYSWLLKKRVFFQILEFPRNLFAIIFPSHMSITLWLRTFLIFRVIRQIKQIIFCKLQTCWNIQNVSSNTVKLFSGKPDVLEDVSTVRNMLTYR